MPSGQWTFDFCDRYGATITPLTNAYSRTVTYTKNSYQEATLKLRHEDPEAALLLNAVINGSNGGVQLRGWRAPKGGGVSKIRFRGWYWPSQEDLSDTAELSLTFRSPFAAWLGDGSDTGVWIDSLIMSDWDTNIVLNGMFGNQYLPTLGLLWGGVLGNGVKRSVAWTSTFNAGAAIQSLAQMVDGRDFYETPVETGVNFEGDPYAATFWLTSSLGSVNSSARFEYGRGTMSNVSAVTRQIGLPANPVVVEGNGVSYTAVNGSALSKWGTWPVKIQASSISELAQVTAMANARLSPGPVTTISFTPEMREGNCPCPFDDYNLGDTVPFYGARGAFTQSAQLQIQQIQIAIDDAGFESASTADPLDRYGVRQKRSVVSGWVLQ